MQKRPKRKRQETQYKPLTQEELLFEAAQTEIENLRSLEIMQAIEEEVKKKAAIKRARYSGPYIRYSSKKVNDEALVRHLFHELLTPHFLVVGDTITLMMSFNIDSRY